MKGVEHEMLTPPTVAVIGGGQLARMMQESAVALGINLRALVEASDGSTGQVTVDKAVGEPADLDAVRALIDGADVLTFEHEHIPARTMEEAARLVSVQPPASALLYAQDKLAMRERLTDRASRARRGRASRMRPSWKNSARRSDGPSSSRPRAADTTGTAWQWPTAPQT